jgi:dihydropteroate synthase
MSGTVVEPGLIRCGRHRLRVGARTLVMGIVNLTPDSFSGDGVAGDLGLALERGRAMVAAGADILDVGGESTRPGAETVLEEVELARVLPAVGRLAADLSVPISIDTRKARVAEAALAAGATMVNDVSGLDFDPRLAELTARADAALVIGHWRRRAEHDDGDLIEWVAAGLRESVARARAAGVARTQIVADPGLGFAKPPPWTFKIIRRVADLRASLGLPILIGASRKSSIGRVLGAPPDGRLEGSLAAAAVAVAGGADIVRVHDVAETVRAVTVADAICRGWGEPPPTWTPVYLGLGANLGDRATTLAVAMHSLAEHPGMRVIRRSGLYETAPVGVTDQPDFLNAVLEAETTLPPRELLALVKRIEAALGRQAGPRWGPRELDVDILLYGDERVDAPDLTIPHRELWNRPFVLVPLAELRPDLAGPDGRTLAGRLAEDGAPAGVRALGW